MQGILGWGIWFSRWNFKFNLIFIQNAIHIEKKHYISTKAHTLINMIRRGG